MSKIYILSLYIDCSPLQLWLLSRHGTRHPHFTIIDNIAKLNEYKNKITENSSMSKDEIEAIQTWQFNLTELDGNQLNSQGIDDLLSLGLKLRQSYAEIFNETYNSENFEVTVDNISCMPIIWYNSNDNILLFYAGIVFAKITVCEKCI